MFPKTKTKKLFIRDKCCFPGLMEPHSHEKWIGWLCICLKCERCNVNSTYKISTGAVVNFKIRSYRACNIGGCWSLGGSKFAKFGYIRVTKAPEKGLVDEQYWSGLRTRVGVTEKACQRMTQYRSKNFNFFTFLNRKAQNLDKSFEIEITGAKNERTRVTQFCFIWKKISD